MNPITALVIIFVHYHHNHVATADRIRGHWLIENSLHWGGTDGKPASPYGVPFKDVIYEEDISPQKAGLAPRNLSLLKTWVLTLLRTHGFDSIKAARALNES